MERLKKILTTSLLIVLSLCLTFVFTACDKNNNTDNTQIEETNNNDNTNNGSGDNSNENTINGNINNNEQKAQLTKEYVSEMLQNSYYNSKALDFEVEVKGDPSFFRMSKFDYSLRDYYYYDIYSRLLELEDDMYSGYIRIYDGGYIYNDDLTVDEVVDIKIQFSVEEIDNQPTQVVSCVLDSNVASTENIHLLLWDFSKSPYMYEYQDAFRLFEETENIKIYNNNEELFSNCDYEITSLKGYAYPVEQINPTTIIKGSVNFYGSTPTLHLYIFRETTTNYTYKIEEKNHLSVVYKGYSVALKDGIFKIVDFKKAYKSEYKNLEDYMADLDDNIVGQYEISFEDFMNRAEEIITPMYFEYIQRIYGAMQMTQGLEQTENNVLTLDTLSALLTNNLNKFYDIKIENNNITLDYTLDMMPLYNVMVKCMQDNDNCLVAFNKIAHALGYESTTFIDDLLEVLEKMLYIKDEFGSISSTTVKNVLDELDSYLLNNGYTFTTQSILTIVEAMGFELPFEDTTNIEELYNTYSALLMEEETNTQLDYAGLIDAVKTLLKNTNCRYVLDQHYDEEDSEPFNPFTEVHRFALDSHIELEDTKMKNITLTYDEAVDIIPESGPIEFYKIDSTTTVKFSTRDSNTVSDEVLQKVMNNYYYNLAIENAN